MEALGSTHCARCGAVVEGEACPQCGLRRGEPAWQPPAGAAPAIAPAPEHPQWSGPPPQHGGQAQWAPPGSQLPPGELSGWWRRVGAYLLDGLVMLFGAVLVYFLAWGASGDAEGAGVAAYVASLFLFYVVYGLIYAPFLMRREGARNGQTLGKQALGIRVVRLDARPMDYGSSALREWVAKTLVFQLAAAFVLGLATLIDYLWPLWDKRNQALHDKLASTLVMKS